MPECRGCGVALDWHEHELCAECWEAREVEDDGFAVVIFDSGDATDSDSTPPRERVSTARDEAVSGRTEATS